MTPSIEDDFWTYSVETYSKPGAKVALLKLQDRYGYVVNTVLWATWAANRNYSLTLEQARAVAQSILDMDRFATYPLRSIRRYLTSTHPTFDAERQDALRQQVLDAEIETEKLVLHALARTTQEIVDENEITPLTPEQALRQAREYFTVCGEYLETPRLLVDDEHPDEPTLLFDVVLRAAGLVEGNE